MPPEPGTITRINAATGGISAGFRRNAFSPDGTRMLFISDDESNRFPGDTNNIWDLFALDLATGTVTRVNTAADGTQADNWWYGYLGNAQFFPDSTRVLFESYSSNLVPGDTNDFGDLFVKDLSTGAITRVNTAADGTQGNTDQVIPDANHPDISADGTRVLFLSAASNLVPGDTNGIWDLFVKDLATGAVTRVNTAADGTQAQMGSNGDVDSLSDFMFSPDGTHVLFHSVAANLVPDDTDGTPDYFIKNLVTGAIIRITNGYDETLTYITFRPGPYDFSADGSTVLFLGGITGLDGIGLGGSFFVRNVATGTVTPIGTATWNPYVSLSSDGTRVAFTSSDPSLVPGDTNGKSDLFAGDLTTGAIARVNTDAEGTQSAGSVWDLFAISPDGTQVLFFSDAADLVPGDTNNRPDLFLKTIDLPATAFFIAASQAEQTEGDTGTTEFAVTVTRRGDITDDSTIAWSVAGTGPAPADAADFAAATLPGGLLSFAPGETTRTVAFAIAADTTPERHEFFAVTLSTPGDGPALASTVGTIANDDAFAPLVTFDASTASAVATPFGIYSGPVAGIETEWSSTDPAGVTVAASSPNWFIHTGSGDDAIAVISGRNVLDGGGGSNFLTGGAGADSFFIDVRDPAMPGWSTIAAFGPGDSATLWGLDPDHIVFQWLDDHGAPGFTGLTLHATTQAGTVLATLTLAGFAKSDFSWGRLSQSFGFDPDSGTSYLHIART